MPFISRWSKFAGKMSDTFPAGDIIWDKVDQAGWEFRHQTAPALRIEWSAVKTWKDIIPVTKQNLGTVDYSFNHIWGDKIYANLFAQAPQVVTDNLSLGRLASDPALIEGLLWYRSDLKRLRYYDGVFSRSLVHLDEFSSHASRHASGGDDAITSPLSLSALSPVGLRKVMEINVTSNTTQVTITGLDINTDKFYLMFTKWKNSTTTRAPISMYVEGDTTATNYYVQFLGADGATLGANRENDAYIADIQAGNEYTQLILMQRTPNGYPVAISVGQRWVGSAVSNETRIWSRVATTANITRLDFIGGVEYEIGAGSRIIIFGGM
jgi:hypothetical protein